MGSKSQSPCSVSSHGEHKLAVAVPFCGHSARWVCCSGKAGELSLKKELYRLEMRLPLMARWRSHLKRLTVSLRRCRCLVLRPETRLRQRR